MKTAKKIMSSLTSVNMKNKTGVQLSLLASLLSIQSASAQSTAALPISDKITYSVLIGLGVVFIIIVVYTLTYASKALRENGGTLDLSFPLIRKMAFNGKTVGIIFLIIILLTVIWALNF